MANRYDPRMQEDRARTGGVLYVLMVVIALAFGGFVWQLYSAPSAPHIAAPAEPYKIAPPPSASTAPDQGEQDAFAPLDGADSPDVASAAPSAAATPAAAVPVVSAGAQFAANGPYVAQLAALQSEAAVQAAWSRLASRAPNLFAPAQLDVQRADLGARGVYFRVRAGYFADRANASAFCERIRQMGQDCIPVAR